MIFEPGGPSLEGATSIVSDLGPGLAAVLGTQFCAYDRAGTGQSDPHLMGVRTFEEAASDLNAVLASPELGCPCVVVGESLGGSISLVALAADPSDFAGLVLLDPPYPGYFDLFLALSPPGAAEVEAGALAYYDGENEEGLDVATGFSQVTVPAEPPAIPVIVVTHGAGDPPPCFPCSAEFPTAELESAWQAGEADLAEAPGGQLVVADGTSHSIADENPELVVSLVAEVIAAVRDPNAGSPPTATPSS